MKRWQASWLSALVLIVGASPDEAFAESRRKARAKATAGQVRLLAVGDVLFGRYLRGTHTYRRVATTEEPFAEVRELLQGADIAFANLESPVMEEPESFTTFGSFTFRAEPRDAEAMAAAGFDVVSLANNHSFNVSMQAPAESREHVLAAGMHPVGVGASTDEAQEPAVVEVNGARIAFVAATAKLNREPVKDAAAVATVRDQKLPSDVVALVERAKALSPDAIVLSLHWGKEYELAPDDSQRRAARAAIRAGADVVLGHHAHVVQEVERYRGGVIAYSLGNFLFDQKPLSRRESMVLEVVLEPDKKRRVRSVRVHPVLIDLSSRVPTRRANPMLRERVGVPVARVPRKRRKLVRGQGAKGRH